MDELAKLVSQKAGISQEQAKTAVLTVVKFLKDRLPAPVAGQLDAVLSGISAEDINKGLQSLGGMFGKK